MIKKFDIENFGSYKNYKWCNFLNNDNGYFNNVNIIYGRNYSGKTTLSRLLRMIENRELHNDYKNAKFSIDTIYEENHYNQNNITKMNSKEQIFVYNTDFIKDNLQWLVTDQGTISSFAILGKENIELKEKVNLIEEEILIGEVDLRNAENKYDVQKNLESKLKKEIEDSLTNNARLIRNNPQWYDNPNYKRNNLEKDMKKSILKSISPQEKENYLSMLKEDSKTHINTNNLSSFDIVDSVEINSINLLLKKKIKISNVIKELVENNILQDWIKEGYILHKNKEEYCKFCNNKIEKDIFTKLESHFSKESQNLIKEIDEKIIALKKIQEEKILFKEKKLFYLEFQNDIEQLNQDIKNIIDEQKNWIESIINQLDIRRKNIFTPLNEVSNYTGTKNEKNTKKLISLIDKSNKKSKNIDSEQRRIKEILKENKVLEIKNSINYDSKLKLLNSEKSKTIKLYEELQILLNKKDEQILLKKKYLNELSAEENTRRLINQYLTVFFSKTQIAIEIHDEDSQKFFKIVREGKVALNLSEGERRIISFCYFLAKINDALKEEKSDENLILYIDDPISSLDNNHIFTIFSLINELIIKKGKYKQLFISTHSLEFLRYLKRLSIEDKLTNHYYIEREIREKDNDSKSNFTIMPKHLKTYTTEFHHLFKEIYQFHTSNESYPNRVHHSYTTHYNLPNNIRKFLEIYLFYKFPSDEILTKKVERFFGDSYPTLLNRIINEYSHLTSLERGYIPFEIAELKQCVNVLIETMEKKDPSQLNDLINSVK